MQPESWSESQLLNILTGNFCMPRCEEPWYEALFESPKEGKAQVGGCVACQCQDGGHVQGTGNASSVVDAAHWYWGGFLQTSHASRVVINVGMCCCAWGAMEVWRRGKRVPLARPFPNYPPRLALQLVVTELQKLGAKPNATLAQLGTPEQVRPMPQRSFHTLRCSHFVAGPAAMGTNVAYRGSMNNCAHGLPVSSKPLCPLPLPRTCLACTHPLSACMQVVARIGNFITGTYLDEEDVQSAAIKKLADGRDYYLYEVGGRADGCCGCFGGGMCWGANWPRRAAVDVGRVAVASASDPIRVVGTCCQCELVEQSDPECHTAHMVRCCGCTTAAGGHNLAAFTTKGDLAYLFVLTADEKQWAANEGKLRTMLETFSA